MKQHHKRRYAAIWGVLWQSKKKNYNFNQGCKNFQKTIFLEICPKFPKNVYKILKKLWNNIKTNLEYS